MSNQAYVNSIATDLDFIATGDMFKCPCCESERPFGDCSVKEDDDTVYCPECGEPMDEISMWDHLNDMTIYGLEYRVDSKHADYINSVRIMVACGGPNVYIDTASKSVDLYWWGDHATAKLSDEATEEIESFFNELWNCE